MRTGICWLVLLLSFPSHGGLLDKLTAPEPQFLPTHQAFPLSIDIHNQTLTAHWNTAEGYYLYQHRIYLVQDSVRTDAVSWSEPGLEKYDEAFGDIVAFYGSLSATFDLSGLTKGEVILHYQGCADAGLCYPPQRLRIEIPAANTPQPISH